MANNLLTMSQITNQALNVLEKELNFERVEYSIGIRAKKFAILKKYRGTLSVEASYDDPKEAEAVLKIINFTEGN